MKWMFFLLPAGLLFRGKTFLFLMLTGFLVGATHFCHAAKSMGSSQKSASLSSPPSSSTKQGSSFDPNAGENETDFSKIPSAKGGSEARRLLDPDEKDPRPIIYYRTTFEGIEKSILVQIKPLSVLELKRHRQPHSRSELYYRAQTDVARFRQALQALGYFDAQIDIRIHQKNEKNATVHLLFQLGEAYKVENFNVIFKPAFLHLEKLLSEKDLKVLKKGEVAEAFKIRVIEKKIWEGLTCHGYPWASIEPRKVTINPHLKTMNIELNFMTGIAAKFGATQLHSLPEVKDEYIVPRISWKQGQPYNANDVEKTKQKLSTHGLFSSIAIEPSKIPTENGEYSMILKPKPGKFRHIGAGLQYSTDDKLGLRVFWAHRNLFRKAEKLGFTLKKTGMEQTLETDLHFPDFRRYHQSLSNKLLVGREKNRAYIFRGGILTSKFQRSFHKILSFSIGASAEKGRIHQLGLTQPSTIFSLPLSLEWNTTNSLLNPKTGGVTHLGVTPYVGHMAQQHFMYVPTLRQTYHWSLGQENMHVFALWGEASLIGGGISRDNIPANHRLYGGGGNSVRAYESKMVSPLMGTTPLGGRSLVEGGAEYRHGFTDQVGGVVFLESALISSKNTLQRCGKAFTGAGVGLRYHSPLGPLRFDVAVPLHRRRDLVTRKPIDRAFQFYVSLGQAF